MRKDIVTIEDAVKIGITSRTKVSLESHFWGTGKDPTWEEVANLNAEKLLKSRNFGKVSLEETRDLLAKIDPELLKRFDTNSGRIEKKKLRKIIQITSDSNCDVYQNLYGLCDDGTVWDYQFHNKKWMKISMVGLQYEKEEKKT